MQTPVNICGVPALVGSYDNYIWILYKDNLAWVIDPGESKPVLVFLENHKLNLQGILLTHRHGDHINGVRDLVDHHPLCQVFGPQKTPFDLIQHRLSENDEVTLFSDYSLKVLDTPGHTEDHMSFYNEYDLFCGDTLFTGGCGRILGGTYEEFAASILKIRELPDHLNFYCAHKYTADNLAFAVLVDENNSELSERAKQFSCDYPNSIQQAPLSTLGLEKRTNPFMRFDQEAIKALLIKHGAQKNPAALFKTLRGLKDHFDQTGEIL